MKFKIKENQKQKLINNHKSGDKRIIRKFLWKPIIYNHFLYWLEFAIVEQVCVFYEHNIPQVNWKIIKIIKSK